MPFESYDVRKQFESGVVILSLDTEQIWGYLDQLNETQFRETVPQRAGRSCRRCWIAFRMQA